MNYEHVPELRRMEHFATLYERVVHLRRDMGLTYKQIVDVTGAPIGTVCSMIKRANLKSVDLTRRQTSPIVGFIDDPRALAPD